VKPAQKRAVVAFLRVGFALGERRACRVLGLSRSVQRCRSVADDQAPWRQRLRDLAAARVRSGYRRLHVLLRREGWRVNHKRVERLSRLEGISPRRKARTKRLGLPRVPVPLPTRPNDEGGMDFRSDRVADGRRFRVLT
jgi:putative transposase